MKKKNFNRFLEKKLNQVRSILIRKNEEYSNDEDALEHFKRASEILRCSAEEALVGMQAKHITSILELVDVISLLEEGEKLEVNEDYIEEKITDVINYFILLEALIKERLAE
jgi:hypothetical protein